MRLKLVPTETKIDFFSKSRITFGASIGAVVLSVALFLVMGLNFGIDFKGGTTIRTQSAEAVDVGDYRAALSGTSLFTTYFVTRLIIIMWFERRRPKTIEV